MTITKPPRVQVMNVMLLNVTMETVARLLTSVMAMMTVETTVMRTTVLEVSIINPRRACAGGLQ